MITRSYLLKMSEMDDEDGFDPADYTLDELYGGEDIDDFKRKYKEYYDDVKTSQRKFTDEDW